MNVTDFSFKVIILTAVVALLPYSPFQGFNYLVNSLPYIGYLNWILPISEMLVIMESWLAIVASYYTILFALNYVGILKT